jgi:microcystin-dependent protein
VADVVEALGLLSAIAGYARADGEGEAANRPPKLGTVDPGYTSGSPRVTFDGESTMSTKLYPCLGSYSPAAGDRVLLLPVGTGYVVVGAVSAASPGTPVGAVQAYAGASAPTGWLACDGSAVSRTTYAGLYAAIGTAWGSGNGTTTFNVPDLRGRAPVGAGTGAGLTARALAATGGAETHTATVAHTHTGPSHTHTTADHQHQGPSHAHGVSIGSYVSTVSLSGGGSYTLVQGGSGSTDAAGTGWTSTNGAAATSSAGTGATSSTGSASVDHMPPFAAMTYIIRV